ncbi:hypothetical protein LOD99_12194 [Oopsacas minuta]|uniref:Uncharacterized protein n=1 Tax=Oopsacas minuta TaxID=111878 RepID=A0AAV7JEJ1_9METZ|nr:hypothetical protein LOD99_12194 [Oopsacas minuta]
MDGRSLNPEAVEFRPQNLPITNPPTFLPAPPVLENIASLLCRSTDSPPLQQLIETYKCVLTFIASNPESFDLQTECLRSEIHLIPRDKEITKQIKEGIIKMNIELAIIEPEYRSQSARLCLRIDSFFQEYYQREFQEYQDLSMDYLKKRYLSFGDKIVLEAPDLIEELVGYAATLADYLTRFKGQKKSVEKLGKAMIEVLLEALKRKFNTDNIKTIYDTVKMSCRTLFNVEKLNATFEELRDKLRDILVEQSTDEQVKKLVLKLLEYISYNEGTRDCLIQTTDNNQQIKQNGTTINSEPTNPEESDDYMPNSFIPGPEIPVTDAEEWSDFIDEFGKPIESPSDECGDDQFIVGHDLLSPSVARDFVQFSSEQK